VVTLAPASHAPDAVHGEAISRTDRPGELRVRIHRGSEEIGGSCVEVEYRGSRIVLEVGKPLWAGWDEVVLLPDVPGLADGSDPSLAGVFISHPHLDHFGLIGQVDSRVPVFVGREAVLLLAEAEFFSAAGATLRPTGFLAHRVPLRVGAFTVTPYLADHSGFDAYSLLVEAGGRRLFYTGDLRGHGRKARLFDELVLDPPRGVDVLLCEGTHIRSTDHADTDVEHPGRSESDVEFSLAQHMGNTPGAVTVLSSAQNIDRLVTVYRACRRAGRTLVADLYTASIVAAIARSSIPQPGFPGYKVYVPNRQRVLVKTAGQFDRMELVRACRVYPEWLAGHAGEVTLLQCSSAVPELLRAGVLAEGKVVWSMWPGYLRDAGGSRLVQSLASAGVPFVVDHSSGHASTEDLTCLVGAMKPTTVVPIHTEGAERYPELFPSVARHADGEWWLV
jgi:ribonuclease J